MNSRFLFKSIRIDQERGLVVATDRGEELSPSQLSSGEQHELVLAYSLLFRVSSGSLVLVDEPEISLHVSWQQNFLDDIARIAEVASLRFIVATHSPQDSEQVVGTRYCAVGRSNRRSSPDFRCLTYSPAMTSTPTSCSCGPATSARLWWWRGRPRGNSVLSSCGGALPVYPGWRKAGRTQSGPSRYYEWGGAPDRNRS